MKTAKQILDEFYEVAEGRCALALKNGTYHEGYVLAVEENHIVWGEGGPLAPKEDLQIPIADIDLNSLSYWSEKNGCYMDVGWDEQKAG